jgi:hypothetical protein
VNDAGTPRPVFPAMQPGIVLFSDPRLSFTRYLQQASFLSSRRAVLLVSGSGWSSLRLVVGGLHHQLGRKRLAVLRPGVIPIPRRTAPMDVPLNMLSYCSILSRELYGCREMRRNTLPVTSSQAPKSASYRYFEMACSGIESAIAPGSTVV